MKTVELTDNEAESLQKLLKKRIEFRKANLGGTHLMYVKRDPELEAKLKRADEQSKLIIKDMESVLRKLQ